MPCAVIYKQFLEMTGAEMIWIPGVRLCDGIAAEFAADKKLIKFRHNFDNDIISTSRSMAKRYQCLSRHTETVEKYVLQIFDTMRKYHGMGQRERLLLQKMCIRDSRIPGHCCLQCRICTRKRPYMQFRVLRRISVSYTHLDVYKRQE